MSLQINERVLALGKQAEAELSEQFARIDAIAAENTQRVLGAFQEHRVAENYFAGTTGYGYDDIGRDKLDEIYADLFGTEAALVCIFCCSDANAVKTSCRNTLNAKHCKKQCKNSSNTPFKHT